MPRYSFGPFSLDPEARVLLRNGEPVSMAGKTFDTLLVLVQNRGRLMDKDELLAKAWPDTVVEEANLSQSIFTIRKILGDSPKDHRYIATIAGRGYQFVAQVSETVAESSQAPPFWRRNLAIRAAAVVLVVALAATAWLVLRRPSKSAGELMERRLTFNSGSNSLGSSVISPDSQYLAYSDPAGIHVKLLSSGEERLISRPAEVPVNAVWDVDSWFPDGTRLLANSEADGNASMWSLSVLGNTMRKIREGADGWKVSPDGRHIAFSPKAPFGNFHEIWIMGSEGEDPHRVLAVGQDGSLCRVHWSPDGQRLAYVRTRLTAEKLSQSIETCNLKGTNRTTVLAVESQSGRWMQAFWWLPSRRIIYSQLETPDSSDQNLWQIGVDASTGTPIGEPKRITHWDGSSLLALSASASGNRLAFLKAALRSQVYVADLAHGGAQMSSPRRLTDSEASDSPTTWTADSKAVVFTSDRVNKWGIFKQEINRQTAELVISGQQYGWIPRLSADGAWLLYVQGPEANGPSSPLRLVRVPVNGGIPHGVLETRRWKDWHCVRPAGNLCVILEGSPDESRLLLTEFDPLKGRGRLLRTIEGDPSIDYPEGLAPDGSSFAIAMPDKARIHIRLLSLTGGADREILVKGWGGWRNISGLDWSADGRGFYLGTASAQGGTLLYLDLNGNARVLWQFTEAAGTGVAAIPSPDGRHLAIWSNVHTSNAWMLEGF